MIFFYLHLICRHCLMHTVFIRKTFLSSKRFDLIYFQYLLIRQYRMLFLVLYRRSLTPSLIEYTRRQEMVSLQSWRLMLRPLVIDKQIGPTSQSCCHIIRPLLYTFYIISNTEIGFFAFKIGREIVKVKVNIFIISEEKL